MSLYTSVVRPVLFRSDPEWIHDRAIRAAERVSASPAICARLGASHQFSSERLEVEVAGLRFHNPLGLAAGFGKNGRGAPFWAALGFGHVEIGSISAFPSAGNPRPRLFRIPQDRAIVVNYGLPNEDRRRASFTIPP